MGDHATFDEKLKFFSTGRIGVRRCNAPPSVNFAERFLPLIGGRFVAPKNMPEYGYETFEEAMQAAREFRMSCVHIRKHGIK